MEWTDETIARLRAFWDEGHSTAEIGRRLGVSKNAIVGKAHRLALPARPSPIRREAGAPRAPRRAAPRITGPTLPPLAAPLPMVISAAPAGAPRPPPRSLPRSTAVPRFGNRLVACCWPIGDPGTPSFRFCDAEAVSGKPYCTAHAQLAYVKVRDRREEAA